MTYIWQDFNIKTMLAETIVFRDGEFCPELSTLDSAQISKNYDLPVHYIYVGELVGKNVLEINIPENVKNQKIYLSVRVTVNSIADFNILIKNSGLDSNVRCFIVLENHGNLNFDINTHHLARNTGIFAKTRLLAYKKSVSNLSGAAHIYQYCENSRSGIDFSAMADNNAKIIFKPIQKISAIPDSAEHSANIAEVSAPQVEYLHESGLNDAEIKSVMRDAFINNTDF